MPDHITEPTEQSSRRYRCRRIFTDGRRCGSPCLRREEFCYYHHTTRLSAEPMRVYRDETTFFTLPPLEDRSAIQSSITEVLQRLAGGNIDKKCAGLLLYGLQIAMSNLPRSGSAEAAAAPVEKVMSHPQFGYLAPRTLIDDSGQVIEELEEEGAVEATVKVEIEKKPAFTEEEVREMYRRAEAGLSPLPPKPKPDPNAPKVTKADPRTISNLQACATLAPSPRGNQPRPASSERSLG